MDPQVPPPAHLEATPRQMFGELAQHIDEATAAGICADLLSGADPRDYPTAFWYFGARGTEKFLAGTWGPDYWSRVWGARGLLYLWSDEVGGTVLAGLSDQAWRVAEMCLKVAAKREVGGAGDGAVRLADHELSRVRVAALRVLAVVGDTEHLDVVTQRLNDPEPDVRRHADRALLTMRERLDVVSPGRGPDGRTPW